MADATNAALKNTIIEALVLACSHSRLRDVVGTDALRSVLDLEFRDLFVDGTLHLQAVWELFEQQPGFEPEAASAALCRFKTWESQLDIAVELPESLRDLSPSEQVMRAGECEVPSTEVQKVLRAQADSPPSRPARSKPPARQPGGRAHPRADTEEMKRRRLIQIGAIVIAAVGFAVAGFSVVRGMSGEAQWNTVTAASFAGDLPVQSAERIGDQVRATLADESWLSLPVERRQAELETALRALESQGITVLYLRDAGGRICAVAQFYDDGDKVRFQFP